MSWRLARAALVIASGAALPFCASDAASPPRRTESGVYTAQQAVDGALLFADRCAICHGEDLMGTVETPGLTGKFVANWAGRPLGDLFDYLDRAMPQVAPGSLDADDNVRILAYLLRENGVPPGRSALPANSAQLHRIRFEPRPLR